MVMGIIAAVALAFIAGVFVGGLIVQKDVIDESEEPFGRWVWNEFIYLFQAKI